jgi:hypothetical protein
MVIPTSKSSGWNQFAFVAAMEEIVKRDSGRPVIAPYIEKRRPLQAAVFDG